MGALYQPSRTESEIEQGAALRARHIRFGLSPPPPVRMVRPPSLCEKFAQANDVEKIKIIIAATLRSFPGVNAADIRSSMRSQTILRARLIAMVLSKELTKRSLPDLGRRFGGKHHTTILKVVQRAKRKCLTDEVLAQQIATVRASLLGSEA